MNKKRKSALVLSAILAASIFSPVFSSADEVESINLRNFQETIIITDLDVAKAKKDASIKQIDLENAEDDENTSGDSDLETEMNKGYNVKEAQRIVDYARWNVELIEEQVVVEGTENYFNYLLKQDEVLLQEDKIARLNNELAQIETKIALGTTVQSEKVSKELEITKEKFTITTLEYELQALALELNKSLLWDLSTTIEVFDINVPTVNYSVDDLDAVVELVLENHGDILNLTEQIELAEMYLDILYEEDYEDDDDSVIDAKKDISDLELDLRDKKFSLEYDVRSSYNTLLNSRDDLAIKELEVENLSYNLGIVQKRYEVGLEVLSTLELEEENIEFGYLELEQAKLDYYIQVETFKNLVEFENPVKSDDDSED